VNGTNLSGSAPDVTERRSDELRLPLLRGLSRSAAARPTEGTSYG
jgi:hypothetical protein